MHVMTVVSALVFVVMLVAAQAADQHGNTLNSGKLRELLAFR